MLKSEQDRVAAQLNRIQEALATADANYEQARQNLAETLDLTRDCHAAYLEANEDTRRLFNHALFVKIYIDEDDDTRERSARVDYNPPFDDPTGPAGAGPPPPPRAGGKANRPPCGSGGRF